MKISGPFQWSLACIVILAIAVTAASQSRQRVQPDVQSAAVTTAEADSLIEWSRQYSAAMKVADELAKGGSPENGQRLKKDLQALDGALKDYVRVSERLRHRNRALSDTMQFLALQNSVQQESRRYQTISNALKASHDAAMNSIGNMK